MEIFNKLTKATQDAVRGAKDFTDTARLNSLIADEERQITSLHSKIGKVYYETSMHDTGTPIGQLCIAIDEANKRIAKYREEIRQIKGTMHCPKCNAEIPLSSMFCGECGCKVEIPNTEGPATESSKKICVSCGAEVTGNATFCTACGCKQ